MATNLGSSTSNEGDSDLSCKPAAWTDILLFIGANYVAHAATVKSLPGETTWDSAVGTVAALLTLAAGLTRAITAIRRLAIWRNNGSELRKAARAGALCMVARSYHWEPRCGDTIDRLRIVDRRDSKCAIPFPTMPFVGN